MALTPEDVVKKEFSKPKGFGRNGYDEIQVDDFLDEIVVELRRLNAENDELTDKLDDCRKGKGVADSDTTMVANKGATVPALTPVNAGSSAADKAEIDRLKAELEAARKEAKEAKSAAVVPAPVAGKADDSALRNELDAANERVKKAEADRDAARSELERTNKDAAAARDELRTAKDRIAALEKELADAKAAQRNAAPAAVAATSSAPAVDASSVDAAGVLALAQRLHDQHVKDGENERDRLKAEAKAYHERVIGEANTKSEELLTTAKKRHEELLSTGQAKHDELVASGQKQHDDLVAKGKSENARLIKEGTDKSSSLVADAEERRRGILADLEMRRDTLNSHIAGLEKQESDYRSTLKGYLTEQLRKLDERVVEKPNTGGNNNA